MKAEAEDTAAPFDLSRCIGALLTCLSNKLASGASQEYRASFELGVIDWRIMCQLAAEPWSTGAALSQAIGLDKAAVSRSLGLLESRGLVRTRGAAGRRIETALTSQGWVMHRRVLDVALQREARLLTGLSDGEVDLLIALLNRLLANLPLIEADAETRRVARAGRRRRLAETRPAAPV